MFCDDDNILPTSTLFVSFGKFRERNILTVRSILTGQFGISDVNFRSGRIATSLVL